MLWSSSEHSFVKNKKIREEEKVQYNGVRGLTRAPRLKPAALYILMCEKTQPTSAVIDVISDLGFEKVRAVIQCAACNCVPSVEDVGSARWVDASQPHTGAAIAENSLFDALCRSSSGGGGACSACGGGSVWGIAILNAPMRWGRKGARGHHEAAVKHTKQRHVCNKRRRKIK